MSCRLPVPCNTDAWALHSELAAVEDLLVTPARLPALVRGQHFLYVGGSRQTHARLRPLIQSAGGVFQAYAGLVDPADRRSGFEALLPGTHIVCLPLDRHGHDTVAGVLMLCARHGVRCRTLRTASAASFLAALAWPEPDVGAHREDRSPLCLRHA